MATPDTRRGRGGAVSGLLPRLTVLLLAIALAGAVLGPGQRAAADDYDEATLEAFVTVTIEVSRRIEAWRPRIEGEADEDRREALVEAADADIGRAIEEAAGIGEDEYYEIFRAARDDEALRARIERLLSARRQRRRARRDCATAHRGMAGR